MRIDIITVFPEMVTAVLEHSIVGRALEKGLVDIRVVNLRDYTLDRHRTTDDTPYGGGGGMIMKIDPIARALEALTSDGDAADSVPRVVLTDPRGKQFSQETAREWAQEPHLIILCGHYEGVDERVRRHLVTDEVSIGDYILTGGELPALIIADALTRLQPGALGDEAAPDKDTFSDNLLEYPHYTRPREFRGWAVPDILISGHHRKIEQWRRWHQLQETRARRPDLFERIELSKQDRILLESAEPQAPPGKSVDSSPSGYPLADPAPERRQVEMERLEKEECDGTGTTGNP
jgi:tRNA (guanine37-N1)-methyltransferase